MSTQQLTAEVLALTPFERAELAEKLVESLDFTTNDEVRQAWQAEAVRRRDEVRDGRVKTIPGETVLAEIREMLAK